MMVERTPPRHVSDGLSHARHGTVHRFGLVGSTMDEARGLAAAGAPHGTVALAGQQAAGRGRSGRVWASPPGNLHATFVLRPGGQPQHAPQLAFVVALAVAAAVDRLAGPPTTLKWPNDIMRGGAKLAGILLEQVSDGVVLAGIGMNVRHTPPGMPYPVTSLHALGCDAGPEAVLAAVQDTLDAEWAGWLGRGFASVRERWSERGPAPGTRLTVRLGIQSLDGAFAGLREDGALLLDTPGGRRAIVAGDVQSCAIPPDVPKTGLC